MARRRAWFALDVEFMHSNLAKRLLEQFDFAGPVVWVAFLGACSTSRDRGTFAFHNESHGWVHLGLDYPITPRFTLDEFFAFTGKLKQTRCERRGTSRSVRCNNWEHWQEDHRRQKESERSAWKRGTNSATDEPDSSTEISLQNSTATEQDITAPDKFAMPISVDKELEIVKIVAALKDTDQGTLAAVTDAARGVSFGGIRRVRDSVETRRGRVGVGYAVNALRGERPAA